MVDSLKASSKSESEETRPARSGFVGLWVSRGERRAGSGWKGTSMEDLKASFLVQSSLELTLEKGIGCREAVISLTV